MFDTRRSSKVNFCSNAATIASGARGPGSVLQYPVTNGAAGVAGVPPTATAIVMNVTAVHATAPTFITVYPGGVRPIVSSLNVHSGAPVPNQVTVQLSAGSGSRVVDFYNSAGTVDLIGDLAGYFAPGTGAGYTPLSPCRVFDTRFADSGDCDGSGALAVPAKVGANAVLSVPVIGVGGVPLGAAAVVLNVTADTATAQTYVSVYPSGHPLPLVSNLNVNSAAPVPNLVTVPVGADGKVAFYNKAGTVNLIADVAGYFQVGTGSGFTPITPCRVFDTRTGGATCTPDPNTAAAGVVGPDRALTLKMSGVSTIPAGVKAVVLNVTAVTASGTTYITVYPAGLSQPTVSNLNVTSPRATPNAVIVTTGASAGSIDLYNRAGTVNLIADVAGYFS
jgi:hypothetical protein